MDYNLYGLEVGDEIKIDLEKIKKVYGDKHRFYVYKYDVDRILKIHSFSSSGLSVYYRNGKTLDSIGISQIKLHRKEKNIKREKILNEIL